MSAVIVTVTEAPTAIEQAQAIRREVMEAGWPQSREAQWAIGWALGELDDILAVRDKLLNDPEFDPLTVDAPDRGWWTDPEKQALEYLDDQALQAARTAKKRLAEYQDREVAA